MSNSAFAIEDTAENRNKEAERYLSINPPKDMVQDMAKQVAQNFPPENRELFIKMLTQYLDIEALVKGCKESMEKTFTADELAAMADFYGSPAGLSATKKMGTYLAEIMPLVQAETLKAVAKTNRDIKGPDVKENTEPTN